MHPQKYPTYTDLNKIFEEVHGIFEGVHIYGIFWGYVGYEGDEVDFQMHVLTLSLCRNMRTVLVTPTWQFFFHPASPTGESKQVQLTL